MFNFNQIAFDLTIRLSKDEILEEYNHLIEMELFTHALSLVSTHIMILTKTRQIIYMNQYMTNYLGISNLENELGKRPGELVSCINSNITEFGCGTSESCKHCSVLNITLKSIFNNMEVEGDGSIAIKGSTNETLNIHLNSIPFIYNGHEYYILSIRDISDSIRKKELERMFFHDILNTAGAIRCLLNLLESEVPPKLSDDIQMAEQAFTSLIDEINFHKLLSDAEDSRIIIQEITIHSTELISNLVKIYSHHNLADKKTIKEYENLKDYQFKTDLTILKRIIGNMIKNALEASEKGMTVLVGASDIIDDNINKVELWVKSEPQVPEELRGKIFYKSFSTKGKGRGLGTYSMKLFGESYLNGTVGYTSDINGTKFYIRLPITKY